MYYSWAAICGLLCKRERVVDSLGLLEFDGSLRSWCGVSCTVSTIIAVVVGGQLEDVPLDTELRLCQVVPRAVRQRHQGVKTVKILPAPNSRMFRKRPNYKP